MLAVTIYTNLILATNSARLWGHIAIPLLLWAAFRFGPRGVSTAIASFSAIAIWGTIHSTGPLPAHPSRGTTLPASLYCRPRVTTLLWRQSSRAAPGARNLSGGLSVTRILAESPALADALPRIIQRISTTFGWRIGAMWRLNPETDRLHCLMVWPSQGERSKFERICYETRFEKGVGLPGRVWKHLKPAWLPDVTQDGNFPEPHSRSGRSARSFCLSHSLR